MQTFLPYESFVKSARSLDNKRLGKQRVETLQILNVLTGNRILNADQPRSEWRLEPSARGWGNHPMTRMWEGHALSLLRYGLVVCRVWTDRGYNDTCFRKMRFLFSGVSMLEINSAPSPDWLGDPEFHRSHQSNLVRKLPEHYRPQFPDVPDNLPYVWPV